MIDNAEIAKKKALAGHQKLMERKYLEEAHQAGTAWVHNTGGQTPDGVEKTFRTIQGTLAMIENIPNAFDNKRSSELVLTHDDEMFRCQVTLRSPRSQSTATFVAKGNEKITVMAHDGEAVATAMATMLMIGGEKNSQL